MPHSNLAQNAQDYPNEVLDILNMSEFLILFKLESAKSDRMKTLFSISDEEKTMIKTQACQLKKEND